MESLRRHRLVAGSIIILVVALLGWQLLPESSPPTVPTDRQVVTAPPNTEATRPAAPPVDASAPTSEPLSPNAGAVRGQAFDAITNEPVTRFEVRWREPIGEPRQQFNSRQRTFQTMDGRFEYSEVPPGKWSLIVTARGYQRFELPEINVTGGTEHELRLPLQKGHTLRGRVYDQATGVGIAASMDVLDSTAIAGDDGNYIIEGLPPGRSNVAVTAKNYTRRVVTVEIGPETPALDIGLAAETAKMSAQRASEAGRTIRGTVTGLRAEQLQRVTVTAHRDGKVDRAPSRVNDRGEFELNDVAPGLVRVVANLNRTREVEKSIEMSADSDVAVTLHFPPGASLSGRVARNNQPLPGLHVALQPLQAGSWTSWVDNKTSSTGSYLLQDIEPGEYQVVVGSFVSKPMQIQGQTVFDIDLPGGDFSGRVLDDSTSQPLAGASIDLYFADSSVSRLRINRLSDHLGQFSIAGVVPSEYMLNIYRPGYRLYRERISVEERAAPLAIRLRPDKGVEVRGRDAATGAPFRELMVIEMLGAGHGTFTIALPLDESGVGYLPSGLTGSKLVLLATGGGNIEIPEWDGAALDLRFGSENKR